MFKAVEITQNAQSLKKSFLYKIIKAVKASKLLTNKCNTGNSWRHVIDLTRTGCKKQNKGIK